MNEEDYLDYLSKLEKKISNSFISEYQIVEAKLANEFMKNKLIGEIQLGLEEQSISESIAVATKNPKLHALFFDRIDCSALVGISGSSIPWEYVNRLMTYESCLFNHLKFLAKFLMTDPVFTEARAFPEFNELIIYFLEQSDEFGLIGDDHCRYAINERKMVRRHAQELNSLYKCKALPVYSSIEEFCNDFQEGSYIVTQRVIKNLSIVDDEKLEWEQIKQFRQDREARNKYKQFLDFLRGKWSDGDIDYITYQIEKQYEAYNAALRKHGIETRLGVLKDIFSSKYVLPTAIASIVTNVTNPKFVPIVAGVFALGSFTLSLSEYKLNLEKFNPPDTSIAWIYEVGDVRKS